MIDSTFAMVLYLLTAVAFVAIFRAIWKQRKKNRGQRRRRTDRR